MKILYFITKSNWGGAQRHVYDLATAMKDKGHDVAVALGGNGLLMKRLEAAGVYTHSITTLGRDVDAGKDAGSLKEIMSIIRHRRPDVLHLHSPKAAGIGSVAGRLLGVKKIVYTVHGWTFNEDRSLPQKFAIIFFSWLTMMLVHDVVLIAEKEYAQATRFPWVKKKLRFITLGIKPPTFISIDGAKHTLAKMIGMDISEFNKKTIVGTIAELHPNKGLPYLMNAMAAVVKDHPNAISLIMGDGQDKTSLEILIKDLGLEKSVYLLGFVDHAAEYLKAFTMFALSSIKEGLGYVILEAGAAGVPVVSTAVGGIPEAVEDMRSGVLVQSRNPRELAHAISFMIEHPIERKQYGTALKEKVATKYSLDKMVNLIQELYSKPH